MRRQSFYNHRVSIVFCADWTSSATCLFSANRTCIRRTLMRLLRHMRTRASLKIASVIQPGRRWDSRAKLTSPVFLYTFFSENNGIFQVEGGSGGGFRTCMFFITCRRRRTWPHGKTPFWEADWKGGALKIMDVCALWNLLTVAATASYNPQNRIITVTGFMTWSLWVIYWYWVSYQTGRHSFSRLSCHYLSAQVLMSNVCLLAC